MKVFHFGEVDTKQESRFKNKDCPVFKGVLNNALRNQMRSRAYVRKEGTIAKITHTYKCLDCNNTFVINQAR